MSDITTRILVVGVPRGGTTWAARVLGLTAHASFIKEPDNEVNDPFAVRAKRLLGRYPVLSVADDAPREYERLWEAAFSPRSVRAGTVSRIRQRAAGRVLRGVPRWRPRDPFPSYNVSVPTRLRVAGALAAPRSSPVSARQIVVKSVLAALALEWIHHRWQPRVIVVLRHPLNIIASWLDLDYPHSRLYDHPRVQERYLEPWGIGEPDPSASRLTRIAWEIGFLTCVLEKLIDRHSDWGVLVHEEACMDPSHHFQQLCEEVGLTWSPAAEDFLRASNRHGTGYATNRVAADLPESWRQRLNPSALIEIGNVLGRFPLQRWDAREWAPRS
jgi:hypothetical protein